MDSAQDRGGAPRAREADARLGARVRRMSLLWWAAAYVAMCLLNFTTDPQQAWPTDLVSYAGGSLAGLGWSLLVARRLTYERCRLRREAVWQGLGLAVLGGCVCGAVAGVLNLFTVNSLKLDVPVVLQFGDFAPFAGNYAELCIGWCFIYFAVSGSERLATINSEISALRIVAYDSQSELIRNEFKFDFLQTVFSELDELLSLRRQAESQGVVVDVAERLRHTLDRWPGIAEVTDRAGASAGEPAASETVSGVPDLVVWAVKNFNAVNIIFWLAVLLFFGVGTGPYYVMIGGIRGGMLNFADWFVSCVAGCICCVVLGSISGFLISQKLWVKCALSVVFSVIASYVSACFPFAFWISLAKRTAESEAFFALAFYYGCSYAAWYCLYFYAQAVRREVAQRAVLARAAEAAAAARNSVLRYQVRPHFLFNALNALYVLIADRRWAAARGMTQALSQYMERAFVEDQRALVPIGEQVEALQAYLGIEKIRFGDRLRFRAEIPERLAHACAPSLILHPLVENAMKYAVAATADPVDVELTADHVGDTLRLRVRDSGGAPEAPAAPGLGIGLRNVAARLAGHYGERGLLECKRLTPKGFVAEIRVPLEFACTPFAA